SGADDINQSKNSAAPPNRTLLKSSDNKNIDNLCYVNYRNSNGVSTPNVKPLQYPRLEIPNQKISPEKTHNAKLSPIIRGFRRLVAQLVRAPP
ncbi:hypothetical protein, partial [Caballeronia glebae]|uniref:hypothetical protein n=1 Tax=Caballeronia glebae TaxID=1777143 RepID=UPI001F174573